MFSGKPWHTGNVAGSFDVGKRAVTFPLSVRFFPSLMRGDNRVSHSCLFRRISARPGTLRAPDQAEASLGAAYCHGRSRRQRDRLRDLSQAGQHRGQLRTIRFDHHPLDRGWDPVPARRLCIAELATMLPHAGGLYVYLREAYGKPVAFLFGWCEMLFSRPASTGALSVAFVGSLTLALGWDAAASTQVVLAIVLLAFLAWVNIVGVVWGGRLQLLTTLIKAGFLAVVTLLPLLLGPFVEQAWTLSNYSTTVSPRLPTLSSQIGAVLLAVLWAYDGWHGLAPLAEEVRRPQRNIPLALFAGVGILIVLYVGANVAYHGVLSMAQMQAAGNHAAEEMLRQLLGRFGLTSMSIVIMCSTFGALNCNLLYARAFPLPWDATECSFASWEKSTRTIARRRLPSLCWPPWRHSWWRPWRWPNIWSRTSLPKAFPGN